MPDVDTRDATLAHFGHCVGHGCAACEAIRRLGPLMRRNPLARMSERVGGDVLEATDAEARSRRHEMRERRRRAQRARRQRERPAILAAIRAA